MDVYLKKWNKSIIMGVFSLLVGWKIGPSKTKKLIPLWINQWIALKK